MIRTFTLSCVLLAAAAVTTARSAAVTGDWMASVSERNSQRFEMSLRYGEHEHSNSGNLFDRAAFTGLSSEQVGSASRVPVQFELQREAGTFAFDGTFKNNHGAGEFTFSANPDFAAKLRALGVTFAPKHGDEDEELFTLAMFDVSSEFIRSMQKIGYSVSLDMVQQFRIFGVDPGYVSEMSAVGFSKLSAEKLVETRIHGATPAYIRDMRAAGNNLTLDGYIESRIFQVSPEFAAEMEKAGYAKLDHDMLVQFRIHGVTTKFVRELRALGYKSVPAEKLVEMRIHGVTPEFIRRVAAAGYSNVPIDKLVQMRIFDIQPEMVRALDDGGKRD
jgi:hypothetical protein